MAPWLTNDFVKYMQGILRYYWEKELGKNFHQRIQHKDNAFSEKGGGHLIQKDHNEHARLTTSHR